MEKKKYKVLELFCGAGGFSLGFKLHNENGFRPFEIAGALDWDRNAVSTVKTNLVKSGVARSRAEKISICGDIREEEVKRKLYKECPAAQIIIGGPPCQSFSTIGTRAGSEDKKKASVQDYRNNLFEHYIEIVNHYKPTFIVFENVIGILSKKDEAGIRYIDKVTERLKEAGYNLKSENPAITTDYLVLNAADYGVPQLRERVIIIGNNINQLNPYPKPTHCPHRTADRSSLLPYVTLRDAIGDLPAVKPQITATPAHKMLPGKRPDEGRGINAERRNAKRYSGSDTADYHWDSFNASLWSGEKARRKFLQFIRPKSGDAKLTGHVARGQQKSDIILFRFMDEGTSSKAFRTHDCHKNRRLSKLIKYKMDSFEDKYKKLSWDRPSTTIFAHMTKDGNRFIHPDSRQGRTLTVREAARLQSFPDDYIIDAIGHRRFTYIGNAVPPLLSKAIAKAISKKLKDSHITVEQAQPDLAEFEETELYSADL